MIFPNNITWVSTIDAGKYNETYRYAIDTWNQLPGRKILFLDGTAEVIPEVEVIDFWSTVDKSKSKWLTQAKPSKKAHRFWFKGHTLYHALKQKYSKYVIWIDADVFVKDSIPKELLEIKNFPFAMMEFKHSLYPEGHLLGRAVESGLQIFDTEHPDIDQITEDYYSYWENGTIFDLYKPYDGWVSTAISEKYNFLNLVNIAHDKRYVGENTFLYTDFKDYLIHFLGKDNKTEIKKYKEITE
jgi:hypothetical protein